MSQFAHVAPFRFGHQLVGSFSLCDARGGLIAPPAYATLRTRSCCVRTGQYDATLTKHVHGGYGLRCCNSSWCLFKMEHHGSLAKVLVPLIKGHIILIHPSAQPHEDPPTSSQRGHRLFAPFLVLRSSPRQKRKASQRRTQALRAWSRRKPMPFRSKRPPPDSSWRT